MLFFDLLPFYAILRSIPNKLMGVIAMFSAILIILTTVIADLSKLRGLQFKPLNKVMFFLFVSNLLLLMVLGAKHVESPYIEIGQLATLFYFSYFIVIIPLTTIFENSINEFYTTVKNKYLV